MGPELAIREADNCIMQWCLGGGVDSGEQWLYVPQREPNSSVHRWWVVPLPRRYEPHVLGIRVSFQYPSVILCFIL